ncbi:hypothetical protein J2I47_23515 [Fibrella sp. HMF5335]|uniref:Uncharacterized protein n=1 Tax=Fibrella rubiginis TaxID=2817060 RepID=A0A939GKJ1_9BACT|nr:hypothetical protein [Fibrella rubiginis]MBO0939538.1 hypothetical protein [Fibrella rubiginis]
MPRASKTAATAMRSAMAGVAQECVSHDTMFDQLISLLAKYPVVTLGHIMLLLPVVFGILRREYLNSVLVFVVIYFAIHFIEQCLLLYYVIYDKKTIGVQKGFLIFYTIIIARLFYISYRNSVKLRRIGLITCLLIGIVLLIDFQYNSFAFIGATLFRLLLIVFSLTYFNKILSENRVLRTIYHPMFWISSGFLIYGMGTFMTSLFTDYLLDATKTSDQTYGLFLTMAELLGIIQCVLVATGMWVSKFDQKNYINQR